jgi:hypothetical protein
MDPGEVGEPDYEQSVRELIRYYAARYREVAGILRAAERLEELSKRRDLFDQGSDFTEILGRGGPVNFFSRSSLTLEGSVPARTYWGSFWQASHVPYPAVTIGGHRSSEY